MSLVLIESRERVVADEIQDLERRIEVLRQEQSELALAATVIRRLGTAASPSLGPSSPPSGDERSKPEGTPTIPEMILWALDQAKKNGFRGLEPKMIRNLVADKWWPDMPNEAANSIAWRMWKRNQLLKDGPLYMLPPKDEAAGTAE